MKYLILLTIRLYWKFIPKDKRRKCIFRLTCSQHVYEQTTQHGFFKGMQALKYRFFNCRKGVEIFTNPLDMSICMLLPQGEVIPEIEIAEHLIPQNYQTP